MQTGKAAFVLAVLALAASTGFARQLLAPAPAPGSCTTIAQTASDAGLTDLLAAATAAGLAPTLSSTTAALTVFAPTNAAFTEAAASLNVTLTELLASPDLLSILDNHILNYPLKESDLIAAGTVKSNYLFKPLTITPEVAGNETFVTVSSPLATANVVLANIQACSSIVHVIDAVLVPVISTASS